MRCPHWIGKILDLSLSTVSRTYKETRLLAGQTMFVCLFVCFYPFWLLKTLRISFNPHDNSIRYLPLFILILQMRGWVLEWLSHMFMFSKLVGSRERIWNYSPSDLRARAPEHCQRVTSKSPGRASLLALQGSCYSYFLCSHLIIFPNENASLAEWKESCFKRKMVSLLLNFWLKIRKFSHLFWSYWSTLHPRLSLLYVFYSLTSEEVCVGHRSQQWGANLWERAQS